MTKTFVTFGGTNGHPNYQLNLSKTQYADTTTACCYCGKAVKGNTYLHLSSLGEPLAPGAEGDHDLGLYPIGSDCAKKAKSAGHTVRIV